MTLTIFHLGDSNSEFTFETDQFFVGTGIPMHTKHFLFSQKGLLWITQCWRKVSSGCLEWCFLDSVCGNVTSYLLCGFCDASLHAYADVVNLLVRTETECHIKFVTSKTRVSPTSNQTIPRLELLSALLLASLVQSVTLSLETVITLDVTQTPK